MLYTIYHIGGPLDGQDVWSPRPYDALQHDDGHVYAAECEGDECLEWVSDDERRITMHYQGRNVPFPVIQRKTITS